MPAGLRILQGRHPLRGPRGRPPPHGRALLPVPLHAHSLHQHDTRLPLSQEQGITRSQHHPLTESVIYYIKADYL